ncbi:MAG: DUF2341 domain-containing protein, partial [Candidatus Hodarchaeota archaeon]
MRLNKRKIWIISILFISLFFTVLPNNFKEEKIDFKDNSNKNYNDNFSYPELSSPSSKHWWDSSYPYRMPITITNMHTDILPKGYSVNISVNTSNLFTNGKLRSDGKDLRLLWYNSSTETWLEIDRINETNFNTENTQIWFKTQKSISSSAEDSNYYLYYGNEQANDPPTNRSKIYDFFDDFTQSDGDAIGWNETLGTQWTVENNEYLDPEHINDRRTVLDTYTVRDASIEVRIKQVGPNNFGAGVMYRYSDPSHYFTAGLGYWSDDVAFASDNGVGWPSRINGVGDESGLVNNSWQYLRIDIVDDNHLIYMDNIEKLNETDSTFSNAGQIGFMTYAGNSDVYFDDLKIRLLVETPPILTIGTEEIYGSWYNTDWGYHKKITITTSSVIIPSGYTVSLTFDHESLVSAGKSRVDGDDLRLVYWNGSDWKELDRMLDPGSSWNSNSTKIWFKTQNAIAASSFDNNYFLYYGNSLTGPAPNNSDNIFFFYDGFESGDFGAWNDTYTSPGDTITIASSPVHNGVYASEYYVDTGDSNPGSVYAISNFTGQQSFHSTYWIYLPSDYSGEEYIANLQFYGRYSGSSRQVGSITIPTNLEPYIQIYDPSVPTYYFYMGNTPLTLGEWHRLEIKLILSATNGRAELWQDGVLTVNESSISIVHDSIDEKMVGIYWRPSNTGNDTVYIDDCFDKLWIDPEPTTTLGNEGMFRPSIDDFTYYKEITIDHTKVSGSVDLINFPILISILDSELHDNTQLNGNDIAFYNGSNWLDHEIEFYNRDFNSTHAKLVAWVRIPSLSPSTDTIIYMYYGNSTMGPQENPMGVWDDNYIGVWHLSEDPTGTVYDSTAKNIDGSSYGSMDSGDQILGKIDGSIDFDGNDDNIATEENNLLAGCSSLTMSAWIKPLSTQLDFCGIIEYDNTTDGSSFDAGMELRSTRIPRVNIWTTSGFEYVDSSVVLPTTQFTYFVFVYDGDLNIYLDGSFDCSTPHSGTVRNNRRYINIGRNTHDGRSFNGTIDEIHISNIDRSADWITTEYNNQYDPNSFYSVGKEYGKYNHPPNHDYFKYYKEIIIDHTEVNGFENLINFPVLINILDSDLHDQNKVQENGNDIAFGLNNIWLDHEIEYFNQTYSGTQAKLVAWVRIPLLSPFTDTIIKMYYGNSTMNSRQNPIGVWDDNYVGVWHLSDDPIGTIYDSTSNNNDGTSIGDVDQIDGKIDGSLNFNGANDYINFGNDSSLDITENITIEHWIKGNDFSNDPDTLTKGTYQESYSVWIWADGTVTFELNNQIFNSTNAISTGVWNYIACMYDGSTRIIFINGTEDNSGPYSTPIEIVSGDLTISSNSWSFNGLIDEIRISNIVRSPYWMKTQYNNHDDPSSFYSIGIENQIDTSAPDITINSPNPNDLFGLNAPDYNLTVIDPNLDLIWYSLDGGVSNSTPVTTIGTIDQTMWSSQSDGNVTIRFYANDTMGNLNYTEVLVGKDVAAPLITITEPNNYD